MNREALENSYRFFTIPEVRDSCETPEYHPRQWVDRSSPAYKRGPINCFPNTTHGSGWIVQVQPTNEGGTTASLNTTHGSGWIVQVQPIKKTDRRSSLLLSLSSRR